MKTLRFLSLFSFLAAATVCVSAQTTTNTPPKPHVVDVMQPTQPGGLPPTPPPGPPVDPAKVAEYQKRFEQGFELQQEGKLPQARAVYESILAEEPNAKRSLLESGRISLRMNELEKAENYLTRLHTLAPDLPEGLELLIQTEQALKNDAKVEELVKQYQALHRSGLVPGLEKSLRFVREQIHLPDGNTAVVTQFFDYTQPPYNLWQMQVIDGDGTVKRQLNFFYDAKAGKELAQEDPKLQNAAQFIIAEDVIQNGKVSRIDAYFQVFSLPEYKKVRNTMLAILGGAYKPVYSQPVSAGAAQ